MDRRIGLSQGHSITPIHTPPTATVTSATTVKNQSSTSQVKAKPVHMDRRIGLSQGHSITPIHTPPTATVTSATALKNKPSTYKLKAKPVHMDRRIGLSQAHSITPIHTPPTATVTSATALKNKPSTYKLKAKPVHMDRRIGLSQAHSITPIHTPPTATVTSATALKNKPSTYKVVFNSFSDLLWPEKSGSFVFDKNTSFLSNPDGNFVPAEIVVPPITDPTAKPDPNMLENKRSIKKKGTKTESRSEALYTVTSNRTNPVFQKIQGNSTRISAGIGRLSRMSRIPKSKIPETVTSKTIDQDEYFDAAFSVNNKSKIMYKDPEEARSSSLGQFTGSLFDKFRLIDTTPTGDDPYQFGEADMRQSSPIPKLFLQNTNPGRRKICSDGTYEVAEPKKRFVSPYDQIEKEPEKPVFVSEQDLDLVKTETQIYWSIDNDTPKHDNISLSDDASLISILPSLNETEYQELLANASLTLKNLNEWEWEATENITLKEPKKRSRKSSKEDEPSITKRKTERRRKRAFSATGVGKTPKSQAKSKSSGKGKVAARGKKAPVPGMTTDEPYHTLENVDDSWNFGTETYLKLEETLPVDIPTVTIEDLADAFQSVNNISYVDTPNAAPLTGSIFDST